MLFYFLSLLPKGKRGTAQRWRMGPTVGILPHMTVLRHPPAGSVCLVFWADRGPGASCPYWEGPPTRFGDFPAVESHAGVRAAPAGAFRGQPPQAALGPRWRSAPKLSAGALRPRWSSAPGKLVSTAYTETYRQAQHELDGTFDRAKVPKARWGVSMRPRPLTTPLGDPEGPRRRASPDRWAYDREAE